MGGASRRIARIGAACLLAVMTASTATAQDAGTKAGASGREAAGAPKDRGRAEDRADAPRREPSPEFREGIRKAVEKRRQRRARRARAMGTPEAQPPGAIVPWPMPPALIIRQTPEVHGEIESLLGQLRRGG